MLADTTTLAPTNAEILDLWADVVAKRRSSDDIPVVVLVRDALAKWRAPAPASGEPAAIVTCDGVMGAAFTSANNYGCDLPVGTPLFTAQEAQVPLSDAQKREMVTGYFSEDWAIENALHLLDDFERHGITAAQKETP